MASGSAALRPSRVVNLGGPSTARGSLLAAYCLRLLGRSCRSEITLRENVRALEDIYLRPRSAVALGDCDLRVSVLGPTRVSCNTRAGGRSPPHAPGR